MPRRRKPFLAALALTTTLALSACGGDEEPAPTDGAGEAVSIDITREGDTFDPNGARIKAEVGEPITVTITSDTAGALHVHSDPEQEIDYTEGTTEHEIVIETPGVVEVESHDPDIVVVQLEVR